MSTATTHETLQAYVNALLSFGDFARYLAEDVTVTFMGTNRTVTGRDAARQLITFVHEQAFKTAVQVKTTVCDGRHAMLEAEFVGTHIGEFEGIPATNRHVRVPYGAAYDFQDGRITALRLYFPMELLLQQISGAEERLSQAV